MAVSQGSAAMSLRCGGMCNDHFVANFALRYSSERILKIALIFHEVINTSRLSLFFFDSQCILC